MQRESHFLVPNWTSKFDFIGGARCRGYGISHNATVCAAERKGAHGVRSSDLINCEVRIKLLPDRADKVLNLFLTILLRRTYILVLLFLAYIWPAFSLFSWRRARCAKRETRGVSFYIILCVTTLANFLCARSTFTSSAINIIITRPVHGVFNEKRIIGTGGRERGKVGALNFLDWSPLLIAPTAARMSL